MASYRIITPLNHDDHRHEADEVVTCIPKGSLAWLTEQGHVALVETPAKRAPSDTPEEDAHGDLP